MLLSLALPVEDVTPASIFADVIQEVMRVAAARRADKHHMLHAATGLCCFYLCHLALVVNL